MLRLAIVLLLVAVPLTPAPAGALAAGAPQVESPDLSARVSALEARVGELAREVDRLPVGLVLFLFGGFCALWAQNTGRNPWAWFALGLVFNVFAMAAVLVKNAREGAG